MVSANDPVEHFSISLQVVKGMFSPIESGIRKAAKDLEHCWPVGKNGSPGGGANGANKFQSFSLNRKSSKILVTDKRNKGLALNVPFKEFFGLLSPHNGGGDWHQVDKSTKLLNDGICLNSLQFAVTWSLLVNGFVQGLSPPFKPSKRLVDRKGNKVKDYAHLSPQQSELTSFDVKKKEFESPRVSKFQNGNMKHGAECFIGFVCDLLAQNLQKFHSVIRESECTSSESSATCHGNQLNCFRAATDILESNKENLNVFLGNLGFAKVGGAPSTIVGVTGAEKEGDDDVSTNKKEDSELITPQKLADELQSVPMSNVEQVRSTLSGVSLTELVELVPNLGRSIEDYPDKAKLFAVQDFFRYSESED